MYAYVLYVCVCMPHFLSSVCQLCLSVDLYVSIVGISPCQSAYVYVCLSICVCDVCVRVPTCLCMHACTYVHVCVYVRVGVCVRVFMPLTSVS